MDHIPPTEGVPAQICVRLSHARRRRKQRLCTHLRSGDEDHPPGNRRVRYPKAPTSLPHAMGNHGAGGASPHLPVDDVVKPAMPRQPQHCHLCGCLRHHEPQSSGRAGQPRNYGRTQRADYANTTSQGPPSLGPPLTENLRCWQSSRKSSTTRSNNQETTRTMCES